MKYPIILSDRIEEIESVVTNWPVEKDFNHVLKWLMQFDPDDIDIGIRIIKNLNVIGYEDLNTSLSVAFSKLERAAFDRGSKITNRNTLFAGIGDGAKSGSMIGYNFRLVNELPEDNFLSENSIQYLEDGYIDNIVLVDDIVGTGTQAVGEIKTLTDKVTPFGVKNIFLLTAVGMSNGIKKVIEETKAHVFSAFEYSDLDTVTNLDSCFYKDVPHEKRVNIRERLEYYGKGINNSPLGYGGVGALIAFYYNTPNISLPVIWGQSRSWIPLFKRVVKINGIGSYYKQIEGAINKKKKENATIQGKEKELIVIVEGRLDESFYEYIFSTIKNDLPYEKINVVSLGGSIVRVSKALIENIIRLSPNRLFVVDDDFISKSTSKLSGVLKENEILKVMEFENYLDEEKMRKDERWGKLISYFEDKIERQKNIRSNLAFEIRRWLLMQGPSVQIGFFENFLKMEMIDVLRKQIIEKIRNRREDSAE